MRITKEQRAAVWRQVWKHIGGECEHCGQPAEVTHHVKPETKSFAIGDQIHEGFRSLKPELKKCIPLCRSCHTSHHNPPGPVVHGNPWNYSNGKCDCERCLKASREYQRNWAEPHREKKNKKARECYAANRDEILQRQREQWAARQAKRKAKKDLSNPTQK